MTTHAAVGSLRVLIVEDETLIRWAVAETLTEAGHTVMQATDGATALQAVAQTSDPFDVVLLDFRLPDSDGLSLLEQIRKRAPLCAVVMMTAFGTPEMMAQAERLGVYEVVAKPFDVATIADVLVKAYRSKAS
jgi:two-component system, NtrC family, response regulator